MTEDRPIGDWEGQVIWDYAVTQIMLERGGSFVQALGRLYRLGDEQNKERLRVAFADYWRRYAEYARMEADR